MPKQAATKNQEGELKPLFCSHKSSLTSPSQMMKPSTLLYCSLILSSWLKLTQPYMHIRIFASHLTAFLPIYSQNDGQKACRTSSSFSWWWQNSKILSIWISTRSQHLEMPMKQHTSSAFSLLWLVWILPQSLSLPCHLSSDWLRVSTEAFSLEEMFREMDFSTTISFFGFLAVNLVEAESSLTTLQTGAVSSRESL